MWDGHDSPVLKKVDVDRGTRNRKGGSTSKHDDRSPPPSSVVPNAEHAQQQGTREAGNAWIPRWTGVHGSQWEVKEKGETEFARSGVHQRSDRIKGVRNRRRKHQNGGQVTTGKVIRFYLQHTWMMDAAEHVSTKRFAGQELYVKQKWRGRRARGTEEDNETVGTTLKNVRKEQRKHDKCCETFVGETGTTTRVHKSVARMWSVRQMPPHRRRWLTAHNRELDNMIQRNGFGDRRGQVPSCLEADRRHLNAK
jgi:hypothetical protein